MAFVSPKDRVRQNVTAVTGTGTFTFASTPIGYQSFSTAFGNGVTCLYSAWNPGKNEWESGIGTTGAGTLARTTVLASSNSGSLVNFTSGTKVVWCSYPSAVNGFDNSGSTIPASPIIGQKFLHTPTGRKFRIQYDGTQWNTQFGFGATTVYVDTTNGTDSQGNGFGTGVNAWKTVQYAVNQLLGGQFFGSITMNIAAGIYRETVTVRGIAFTGPYSLTFSGARAADSLGNTTASSGANPAGNGSAGYGTITKTGATWTVNAWQNLLLEITAGTGSGQIRVVHSNTATVATIVGRWDVVPDNTSQFHIYGWGTRVTGANAGADTTPVRTYVFDFEGQQNAILSQLQIDYAGAGGAGANVFVNNYAVCDITQCLIQGSGNNGISYQNFSTCNTIDTSAILTSTFQELYVANGSILAGVKRCRMVGNVNGCICCYVTRSQLAVIQECYLKESGTTTSGLYSDRQSLIAAFDYTEVDGCSSNNITISGNSVVSNDAAVSATVRSINSGGWGCIALNGGFGNGMSVVTYAGNVSGTFTPVTAPAGGNS